MTSAFLPASYGGENVKTPAAVLKNPYCQSLLNFNTTELGIELRKGDSVWSRQLAVAPSTDEGFETFLRYGDLKLFYAVSDNASTVKYYDITSSGAATAAYTSVSGINGQIFSVYFNKYLFMFGTAGAGTAGDRYNGSAWASWSFSLPSGLLPIGGCGFNHRLYLIGRVSAEYGYGGIDAISGTITKVDLATVITEQSYLSTIVPVTISQNGNNLVLLAFVFFSGEVLFYSGSYPDGNDWLLVGRGKIGKPLTYNSAIDYQGDALIMTRIGLISLRDTFLSGSQLATTKTVSEAIDPKWTSLVNVLISSISQFYESSTGRVKYVSGVWWKSQNRILVSFPVDEGGGISGNTIFVFDTLRGGWAIHRSADNTFLAGIVEFQQSVFLNGNGVANATDYITILQKEGSGVFQDAYEYSSPQTLVSYDYENISASIPYKKDAVYSINGIEPILESDLYAETDWTLIADFGRQETEVQNIDAPTTSVQKPMVNLGITANFVQVKISGTTATSKTVGLELYGYNVWFEAGEQGSR